MSSTRNALRLLALALMAADLVQPAHAATKTWACTIGNWYGASCWVGGVPLAGDDVALGRVGGGNTTLLYGAIDGVRSINNLAIDATGLPAPVLQQSGGDLSMGFATVGQFGYGEIDLSGGIQRIATLVLGSQAAAAGTYKLTGGELLADVAFVGAFGTGTFSQTAGHNQGRLLYIGQQNVPSSAATYQMSGGDLLITSEIRVGRTSGNGNFSQSAGKVQAELLNIGSDGNGSYTAQGTALLDASRINLGSSSSGNGTFLQTGANTVVGALQLVIGQGGAALYTLNSGLLTSYIATIYTRMQLAGGAHQGSSLSVDGRVGSGRASYVMQSGALNMVTLNLGGSGAGGDFAQSGGSVGLTGTLAIADNGSYVQSGNSALNANAGLVDNAGSFELRGGTVFGTLLNRGSFSLGVAGGVAPTFWGQLINQGTVQLLVDATFGNGLRNEADFSSLVSGRTVTLNGNGLDNRGTMTMTGGTLLGNGPVSNSGSLGGWGRIAGSGAMLNSGNLAQSGGDLTLANARANVNQGNWTGQSSRRLVLEGASTLLLNQGSYVLNGGQVSGSGSLWNTTSGVLSGSGTISSIFLNDGTVALAAGDHLTVSAGTKSSGLIDLRGASALLGGGSLTNSGLIVGQGRVANAIDNTGRIQAEGGVLVLAGTLSGKGVLAAAMGATLLVQHAPTGGNAAIQLDGGTVDLAGQALSSAGLISGHGTLRTGGLDNTGIMQFSAGATQVFGAVVKHSNSQIIISGAGDATFYDAVDARAGSELRVSVDSRAIFFGKVYQAAGAAFTGSGTVYFEAGLSSGGALALLGAEGDAVFGCANTVVAEFGAAGHDLYRYGGALQFGGTLKLVLDAGFSAQAGERFDLFDWGSRSGQFAALDLSAAQLAEGLRWDTSQLYVDGSVGVSAVPEPASAYALLGGLVLLAQRAARARAASVTSAGPR